METRAFQPSYLQTVPGGAAGTLLASVTVAATSSAVAGTLAGTTYPNQIQIANTTTAWAYVNFGVAGAVTAATVAASYPVAPGAVVVVTVSQEVNGVSVILSTGSGNVIFTRGEGV